MAGPATNGAADATVQDDAQHPAAEAVDVTAPSSAQPHPHANNQVRGPPPIPPRARRRLTDDAL
eukprot:12351808-Prorocentrum_lima.AAC.1